MNQKLINLLSIPIVVWCGCLALAETNAIILRNKDKWDFIDKIGFIQSPMVMYYYVYPCQDEGEGKCH